MPTPSSISSPSGLDSLGVDPVNYVSAPDDQAANLEGGDGVDHIVGSVGGDVLYGYAGDDTIEGGGGRDYAEGGLGDDTLDGGDGDDVLFGGEGNDVLVGGHGNDNLAGNAGQDFLQGDVGDDFLEGGSGDDTLDGGVGADILYGDSGADTFVFGLGEGADVVGDFTVGEDTIDLSAYIAISSFDDLILSPSDDGVVLDLTIFGGGVVVLEGLALSDLDASSFVFSAGVQARVSPPTQTWHMGSYGDDVMRFGDDDDFIAMGTGDDVVDAGGGDDDVYGGTGDDVVLGGAGNDNVYGDAHDDLVLGGLGDDSVFGGHGNDTLLGGAGDDLLDGGFGDDFMFGGSGRDTFVVTGPSTDPQYPWVNGDDIIHDFTDGGDVIDLSAFSGIAGFSDLSITAAGGDVVIDLADVQGGTLRLHNVGVDELDEDDFVFAESSPVETYFDGM